MSIDIRRLIAMVDGLLGDDALCGGCEYGEEQGHVEYGSCANCRRICADKIIEILEIHKENEILQNAVNYLVENIKNAESEE